jgi:transposase
LLRAGELTAFWVPDEGHEAMRDLVRAREAAVDDLRRKRQVISSLLLKHGRVYAGKTTWGAMPSS